MRVLVAGGCGFIGSNFIRYILDRDRNCRVVNFDKLTYAGNLDNLRDIEKNSRYTFVKGDICQRHAVAKVLKGCDVLINFAAETHVDRSIIDSESFLSSNVSGVQVLLDAVRKFDIKKFIHISTDEVYGSCKRGSFIEGSSLLPNSPYAASKAAADLLCRSYFITYNLPVIITRSSNNFGPYQYPEKFVPLSITNALENKDIPVYGTGKNIRDWIYVLDNCAAIYLVLKRGRAGEIYNIAGGCEIPNNQMARAILKFIPMTTAKIQYVQDRPGHDLRYSLSNAKIRKLGFLPQHKFSDALRYTIAWYIHNQGWWNKIKHRSLDYKRYSQEQYGDRA